MKIRFLLIIGVLLCFVCSCYSPPPARTTPPATTPPPPQITYWSMDVTVTNRLLGISSQQRAFFFQDLINESFF